MGRLSYVLAALLLGCGVGRTTEPRSIAHSLCRAALAFDVFRRMPNVPNLPLPKIPPSNR